MPNMVILHRISEDLRVFTSEPHKKMRLTLNNPKQKHMFCLADRSELTQHKIWLNLVALVPSYNYKW